MPGTPIYDQLLYKQEHKHWWTRFMIWIRRDEP